MEPSHVLAAMGLLTHGNIRMTLHDDLKESDLLEFLQELKGVVAELRR
jgi:cysteine desulfurase